MKYYLKPLHMAPVCSHNPVAWNLSWSPHYERKIKLHLHEVDLREFCRYAKTPHESCKQWPHDVYLKWPTGCLLHCNYQNKFTTWDLWNIFLMLLVIQASYSFPFFPVNLIFWNCWVFLSFLGSSSHSSHFPCICISLLHKNDHQFKMSQKKAAGRFVKGPHATIQDPFCSSFL